MLVHHFQYEDHFDNNSFNHMIFVLDLVEMLDQ